MASPVRSAMGPYRIEREMGGCLGPMSIVYLGHDTRTGRPVVLRPLQDDATADPEHLQRFERDVELLASLCHPNIAAIFGVQEASGRRFLVLEWVEGDSLAKRIASGSLSLEEMFRTCSQISAGLEAAHRCGVVHGDLRPAFRNSQQ